MDNSLERSDTLPLDEIDPSLLQNASFVQRFDTNDISDILATPNPYNESNENGEGLLRTDSCWGHIKVPDAIPSTSEENPPILNRNTQIINNEGPQNDTYSQVNPNNVSTIY